MSAQSEIVSQLGARYRGVDAWRVDLEAETMCAGEPTHGWALCWIDGESHPMCVQCTHARLEDLVRTPHDGVITLDVFVEPANTDRAATLHEAVTALTRATTLLRAMADRSGRSVTVELSSRCNAVGNRCERASTALRGLS